jgi:hypothetical protein
MLNVFQIKLFFIPGVNYNFQLMTELSDLVPLIEKRSVGDISSELVTLLNKSALLQRKIFGFVTDGVVAVIGRERERRCSKIKKQIEKI